MAEVVAVRGRARFADDSLHKKPIQLIALFSPGNYIERARTLTQSFWKHHRKTWYERGDYVNVIGSGCHGRKILFLERRSLLGFFYGSHPTKNFILFGARKNFGFDCFAQCPMAVTFMKLSVLLTLIDCYRPAS